MQNSLSRNSLRGAALGSLEVLYRSTQESCLKPSREVQINNQNQYGEVAVNSRDYSGVISLGAVLTTMVQLAHQAVKSSSMYLCTTSDHCVSQNQSRDYSRLLSYWNIVLINTNCSSRCSLFIYSWGEPARGRHRNQQRECGRYRLLKTKYPNALGTNRWRMKIECHLRQKKEDQRTNGPVNAHLSLLHIPINMFEYYGI